MKVNRSYNLAVVGTESLRGKEIKSLLEKMKDPFKKVEFFDPEVKEEYSKLSDFRREPVVVHSLNKDALFSADLIFLAAEKKINKKFGVMARQRKVRAVDLNEAFTRDADVPVIVSGVNDEIVAKEKPFLVANPNPVTIILSHLFHLVSGKFGISRAIAFVLQPVSAFERDGIDELAGQSVALLNGASLPKKVFKEQIAFNLLSHTEMPEKDGFCPSEKQIVAEIERVLGGSKFPLSLSLIQVPVFHTYSIMTFLEMKKKTDIPELGEFFNNSSFFTWLSPSASCLVSSISVAGKDEIFIGQIKKDTSFPNSFWVWTVADNLTRGSALNALGIGEKLLRTV